MPQTPEEQAFTVLGHHPQTSVRTKNINQAQQLPKIPHHPQATPQ